MAIERRGIPVAMVSGATLRVVSLESRQATAMVRLLERHGCEALNAPSMREVPLSDQAEAFEFGEKLMAGEVDVVVLLTGVGTRLLIDALATRWPQADVLAALGRTTLCCRGPKPVAALKLLGLRATIVAPEPNTWQELVNAMDREFGSLGYRGRRLWVQEYGRPTPQLMAACVDRGAQVESVSIYGWAMPLDTAPLSAGVRAIAERRTDAVMFTSGQQAVHVLQIARDLSCTPALLTALREYVLCVSIGPVTSEALREHGLPIDLEPAHPKMGQMVLSVAEDGPRLLAQKRAGQPVQ